MQLVLLLEMRLKLSTWVSKAGILTLISGVLICLFQNCSQFDHFSGVPAGSSRTDVGSETPMSPDLSSKSLRSTPTFKGEQDLSLWRRRVWAQKCGPGNEWEICFEGQSIPGASQLGQLDWDNPIDDDWDTIPTNDGLFVLKNSWILNVNDVAETFMRVDRTLPGFEAKTGHFWRRDEFITQASGLVAEFRMRVLPQSGNKAIKLHFFDDKQEFKLVFSPQAVSFYDLIGDGAPVIASAGIDNLDWRTYRVVKMPKTGEVQIWVDSDRLFAEKVLIAKSSSLMNKSGYLGRIAARIGFGGNTNISDPSARAAYDVDFFRYKRFNSSPVRAPYELAAKESCDEGLVWKFESDLKNYSPYQVGQDIGKFALTLEFELEALKKNAIDENLPEALSLFYIDMLGGVTATLLPDQVQMKPYSKPSPPTIAVVKGLDLYRKNKLRLVRAENGLYWSLYLNDSSLPQILDVKACGTSPSKIVPELGRVNESTMKVGAFFDNSVLNLSATSGTPFRVSARNSYKLHSFKWIDRAVAPNSCK